MSSKNIVFTLLQQVFIWPEEEVQELTLRIQGIDEAKHQEELISVEKSLRAVIAFQKKTLETAQKADKSFYPELSKKINALYKEELNRISQEERVGAESYLKNQDV